MAHEPLNYKPISSERLKQMAEMEKDGCCSVGGLFVKMEEAMKYCPECGHDFEKKHGTYTFHPPANIPGGDIVIEDEDWLSCSNCKFELLTASLDRKIEKTADDRLNLKPIDAAEEDKGSQMSGDPWE